MWLGPESSLPFWGEMRLLWSRSHRHRPLKTLQRLEEAKDTPKTKTEAGEAAEEASGAVKADIDDDYVADITAAQGTWDPWPTPAQD